MIKKLSVLLLGGLVGSFVFLGGKLWLSDGFVSAYYYDFVGQQPLVIREVDQAKVILLETNGRCPAGSFLEIKVVDRGNKPVLGASVKMDNSEETKLTNKNGEAYFLKLFREADQIMVNYQGLSISQFVSEIDLEEDGLGVYRALVQIPLGFEKIVVEEPEFLMATPSIPPTFYLALVPFLVAFFLVMG
ncbi:hypothetical protein MUP65_02500 [Patescibacteria group bacterium]|nr:hypothetical protein [Patescibacteria group bacterium]